MAPNFRPTKHHLREVLVYFFHLKKTAAESYRLLVDTYGKYALCEVTVRDWYAQFERGDFHVDKELPGYPKRYEDCIVESLLDQDPSVVLQHMARIVQPPNLAYSRRMNAMHAARLRTARRPNRRDPSDQAGTSSPSSANNSPQV